MKFLNPRTDIAFKKLFGNEHKKNLTINFLNSILERKEGSLITEISFRDTANLPETMDRKISFVDINCIDQANNHYIIEMQVVPQAHFLARSQYYSSLVFSRQLVAGVHYAKLVPVIFIGVVNHKLFDGVDVITHYLITNSKTGEVIPRGYLEFHYVELPKFHKSVEQLITETDKWLFFMKNAEELQSIPSKMEKSQDFIEAFHILEKMTWTENEFETYITELDEAGREERIVEYWSEKIASTLLNDGLDHEYIAKVTELPIEYIKKLAKEIKK